MSNGGLISGAFSEQSAHTGGIDLSTKGDLHGYSSTNARIPISTNNFSLLCASAESLGLKWAASPTSVLSGAMDILYSSSANTLARLAAGTDGYVLTTHGTGSVPTWTEISGGATTTFTEDTLSSNFTTDSSSKVDITGLTITLSDSGKFICSLNACILSDGVAGTAPQCAILHDDVIIRIATVGSAISSLSQQNTLSDGGTCDGEIIKCQTNAPVDNTLIRGTGTYLSAFWCMEIA